VLTEVARESDTMNPIIDAGQPLNLVPSFISAAVVNQDDFPLLASRF
jgi:hypothetical protein